MKKKLVIFTVLAFLIGVLLSSSIFYFIYNKKIGSLEKSVTDQLGNYKKVAFDWLENSGEAESLQYQAFNSATKSLNEIVKTSSSKPKAIILDIDETCLDNSPFQGYEILNANGGFDYNTWLKWVNFSEATAIPGSIAFTQQAKKDGVQIFYVSGRSPEELNATIKNLDKLGFADANESGHVILYPPSQGGKQPTFNDLEKNYDVVMYVGDQLSDMGSQFYGSSSNQKQQVTDYKDYWGSKYIAIPNPIYGSFLGAIYNSNNLTVPQQVKAINSAVQTFNPDNGEIYYNNQK